LCPRELSFASWKQEPRTSAAIFFPANSQSYMYLYSIYLIPRSVTRCPRSLNINVSPSRAELINSARTHALPEGYSSCLFTNSLSLPLSLSLSLSLSRFSVFVSLRVLRLLHERVQGPSGFRATIARILNGLLAMTTRQPQNGIRRMRCSCTLVSMAEHFACSSGSFGWPSERPSDSILRRARPRRLLAPRAYRYVSFEGKVHCPADPRSIIPGEAGMRARKRLRRQSSRSFPRRFHRH